MKRLCYFIITGIAISVICSCKKSNTNKGLSSINIVNATTGVSSVVINFSDTAIPYYLNQDSITYGAYRQYGIPSGANPIVIVASSDTLKSLWKGTFNTTTGAIYSFYLSGTGSTIDTTMARDILPIYADSSAGVRFINLSAGAKALTINLQGNTPDQKEFPDLGYKQISNFKGYVANGSAPNYTFEIRDEATGDLLTTVTWNYTVFKNTTMVIGGSTDPNSTMPINAFPVNNF